jgi:hypothetical protein
MRRAVRDRHDMTPFVLALALVLLGYVGLLVTMFPYAIPPTMTIWEAAAPRSSQTFTLVGAAIILPIIIAYTTMGYWYSEARCAMKTSITTTTDCRARPAGAPRPRMRGWMWFVVPGAAACSARSRSATRSSCS